MTCINCRYWRRIESGNGHCFNAPPQVSLMPVQGLDGRPGVTAVSYRPETLPGDECARHTPIPYNQSTPHKAFGE